jgi:hypothetical protein
MAVHFDKGDGKTGCGQRAVNVRCSLVAGEITCKRIGCDGKGRVAPRAPTMYARMIMEACGCALTDAPFVEAWMRLERGTLDGLDAPLFKGLAQDSFAMVQARPHESAELAKSYGLV